MKKKKDEEEKKKVTQMNIPQPADPRGAVLDDRSSTKINPVTEEKKADSRDNATREKETGKQKRDRLRAEKKAKKKAKEAAWSENYIGGQGSTTISQIKTQEEMNAYKNNAQFETYYQGLGLLHQDEWEAFYNKLKEPLDICFRINSVNKDWKKTLQEVENMIEEIKQDKEVAHRAPSRVPWYPNQMTYSFNDVGRQEMRKSPAFKTFHRFLVMETENGRLFRQEKVSMIPVTLLNIETHHSVLDMCAAPGSKTIQILEYLHKGCQMQNKGFCIANDTDMKRAYMLTHQARRLNSPSLFVVNNDARHLPNLRIND